MTAKEPDKNLTITREEYDELRDAEVRLIREEMANSETEAQRQKREYIESRKRQ